MAVAKRRGAKAEAAAPTGRVAVPEKFMPLLEPIDAVHESERNARTGHDVDGIARALVELGWHAPIVATQDGEVLVGNGRLKAARRLGLASVPVVRVNDDKATAVRRMVVDNRLNELSEWDADVLKSLVDDLGDWAESLSLDAVLQEMAGVDFSVPSQPHLPSANVTPDQDAAFQPAPLPEVPFTGEMDSFENKRLIIVFTSAEERDWLAAQLGVELHEGRYIYSVKDLQDEQLQAK